MAYAFHGYFLFPCLMKRTFILLLLSLHTVIATGQMHDALWLYGRHSAFGDPDYGSSVLDFSTEPPIAYKQEREMNLNVTVSSICDSTGNLLFYTNGAWIANFTHEMMENGDSLNPGEVTWDNYYSGLTVAQSHIILPMPENPGKYYLFHERLDYHDVFVLAVNPCYYSVIDMNQNNGLGKVEEKNVVIVNDTTKTFGKITAVKHANGRDWWVLFPQKAKNIFYRFLFSPDGVGDLLIQNLSPPYPWPPLNSNAFIAFSPDGSKLARYEIQHGLYLYDFDRCTGLVENNPLFISIPGTELGGGVAFSPNGRFIYMASSTFILQLDLWSPNIAASLETVAVWDGFIAPNGLSTTFFAMQPGPDGRIYFNTNNGTKYLHYINRPNKQGESCQVVQHGIELPFYNIFTSPNFPNYRLGPLDGSPCDTLGIDNHPLAGFRYEVDTIEPLLVEFTDNSFYEPTEWLWDFGDGAGSAEVNPLHEYSGPGTYTVCLTVSNQYDSDTFCREVAVGTTGAEEALPGKGFKIFPNPAHSSIHIAAQFPTAYAGTVSLSVYNILGKPLWQQALQVAGGEIQTSVDVSTWPPGVYFISLEAGGQAWMEKVVVR
ncbi:MAG: T9SS type A sorting domain-containing protein [Saprospiraceae bacterium]|nr:MAG: T9SS type A sorting domain-containing protein [Saprospiraceae bacterium]